jgi:hypothetical protein
MEPRRRSNSLDHSGVIDCATLFLCRQGQKWVVVIESPRITGAVPFEYTGRDSDDARFELLSSARRACPDAAIMSTDGALESDDYEWRLEVRGIEPCSGDLGVALHRELAPESPNLPAASLPAFGRRCHWGLSPSVSGRPRNF